MIIKCTYLVATSLFSTTGERRNPEKAHFLLPRHTDQRTLSVLKQYRSTAQGKLTGETRARGALKKKSKLSTDVPHYTID